MDYFNPKHRKRLEQSAAVRRYMRDANCPAPRQESDEYVCPWCRLRWDTHEARPACPRK